MRLVRPMLLCGPLPQWSTDAKLRACLTVTVSWRRRQWTVRVGWR